MLKRIRGLSLTTIDNYRKKAKHYDENMPMEVLKIRLNCFVYATSPEHISSFCGTTMYQFGSCVLSVENDIIKNIHWKQEKSKPTEEELKNMTRLFRSYGLNHKGNDFYKPYKKKEYEERENIA